MNLYLEGSGEFLLSSTGHFTCANAIALYEKYTGNYSQIQIWDDYNHPFCDKTKDERVWIIVSPKGTRYIVKE